MGFQGDVAGLGLGELLQGLARGGREGVLTLHGGGETATLGVKDGQIYLLPEPDEDPEIWRKRSERAWVKSPDYRIDHLRMEEIANAARLEQMFRLLDCEGVHFRFEPGPLPKPGDPIETADDDKGDHTQRLGPTAPGAVHSPPISVEFLLLEYARLGDETSMHGDALGILVHDVVRLLDAGSPPKDLTRFWEECDGSSNVIEIADRLGWPLRRCQGVVMELLHKGLVRPAHARELLVLAQREIAATQFARAASRLSAWVWHADAGPPPEGDVELLLAEWDKGRLPAVMASMEPRYARKLLRRLDLVQQDWKASVDRWQELRKHQRHDLLAEIRVVTCRVRTGDEAEAPTMQNLMRLARTLQEAGHSARAGVLLRVAATRMPETAPMRLELGSRMIAVGLVDEGAPWVIEACRALIDSNLAEKAIAPLRSVLGVQPSNREARQLMAQARSRSTLGRTRRRNVLVGMSILLIVSAAAMVQLHFEEDFRQRLERVEEQVGHPSVALDLVAELFPEDDSPRILELRRSLVSRLRAEEDERKEAWLDRFRECQLECTLGDPKLGLLRALEMPPPPSLRYSQDPFPPVTDLFSTLAGQFEQTIAEWGPVSEEASHAEKRLAQLVDQMIETIEASETQHDTEDFVERMEQIRGSLVDRNEERLQYIRATEREALLESQDALLLRGRAYFEAGKLFEAVETYEELLATDESGKLDDVLAEEYSTVQRQANALADAIQLAEDGDHAAAVRMLEDSVTRPRAFLLPWRIQTRPPGARVHFTDGSSRVAPVEMLSTIGERVPMTIELQGHETLDIVVDEPDDLLIVLSREPDFAWPSENPIEAPPVPVREDVILTNRAGRVACLGPDGEERWAHDLDTLGGVARAPVFLPKKPGWLLVLTEDGEAFLLDTTAGELQGPWRVGERPIWGPMPTTTGVAAVFQTGLRAEWEARVRPTMSEVDPARLDPEHRHGASAGLRILRPVDDLDRLDSVDGRYTAWVRDGIVQVVDPDGANVFDVRRDGDWSLLAWEAPRAGLPDGRLWVADEAGLRGFRP